MLLLPNIVFDICSNIDKDVSTLSWEIVIFINTK